MARAQYLSSGGGREGQRRDLLALRGDSQRDAGARCAAAGGLRGRDV